MVPFAHSYKWRFLETKWKQGGNKWKFDDVWCRLRILTNGASWKQGGNKAETSEKLTMYGAVCAFLQSGASWKQGGNKAETSEN